MFAMSLECKCGWEGFNTDCQERARPSAVDYLCPKCGANIGGSEVIAMDDGEDIGTVQ